MSKFLFEDVPDREDEVIGARSVSSCNPARGWEMMVVTTTMMKMKLMTMVMTTKMKVKAMVMMNAVMMKVNVTMKLKTTLVSDSEKEVYRKSYRTPPP